MERPIFSGQRNIRVLRAEDIIGLKVQAMVNNVDRKSRETADIEALIESQRWSGLDWKRVEEYYMLFKLEPELKALKERFQSA